jgi:hypothetical protein
MKKQFNPWEENLGKRLQNMQGAPAFDAWDRIEAELEEKPRRPWLWIAAAIALLLAPAGLWIWHSSDSINASTPALAEKTSVSRTQEVAAKSEKKAAEAGESPSSGAVAGLGAGQAGVKQESSSATGNASSAQLAENNNTSFSGTEAEESRQTASINKKSGVKDAADSNGLASSDTKYTARNAASSLQPAAIANTSATDTPASAITNDNTAIGNIAAAEPAFAASALQSKEQTKSQVLGDSSALTESAVMAEAELKAKSNTLAKTEALKEAEVSSGESTKAEMQHALYAIAPEEKPLLFDIDVPAVVVKKEVPPVYRKEKAEKQRSMASLWVKAQPTLSYSQVEPSTTDGIIITSLAPEPAISGSRLGGQFAAGVSYPLLKTLNWKSGAYYWYQQQRLSYTYHNATPDAYQRLYTNANAMSFSATHYEHNQTIEKSYHNVGISTGLSYKLPTRFVNSFLDTEAMLHYNAEQRINTFFSLGYSVKARLDGRTSLTMGPAVQFQLNNNESISPHFDEKPIIFGLQLGVLLNDR